MRNPALSALDRITDKVISYRPPGKRPTAKKQKAAKAAKKSRGQGNV